MSNIFDYDGVQWYQSIANIQERLDEILENPVSATSKEQKLINQLHKAINSGNNSISISRSSSRSSRKSKSKSKTMKKNRNKMYRRKKTAKNNRSKN